MTEIERKALALVNEVAGYDYIHPRDMNDKCFMLKALCRAIEQHEAYRQEVSDAVEKAQRMPHSTGLLSLARFIIPKPDPLVEALNEAWDEVGRPAQANRLRAALAARGLKIVEDK